MLGAEPRQLFSITAVDGEVTLSLFSDGKRRGGLDRIPEWPSLMGIWGPGGPVACRFSLKQKYNSSAKHLLESRT